MSELIPAAVGEEFVRVGIDNGQVLLLFSKDVEGKVPSKVSVWHIDPPECMDIIEAMAKAAFEADTSLKPVGDSAKSVIVERHRKTLAKRFELLINSIREDKVKSNAQWGSDIADICCSEVF